MINKKPSVLIVDDEPVVCDLLRDELSERGYLCFTAFNVNDAFTKLVAHDFDVALLDIKLPGMSGIEILREIRANHPYTAAIMITGVNNVDTAVKAMKLGASDYIVKPFDLDRVNASLSTVLEAKKCLPEGRDNQTRLCVGNKEEEKPAMEAPLNQMNAIAFGVEAKQELLDDHLKIVTQRTIEIAHQLGIPEKEIQRWAAARVRQDSERDRLVRSSLDKLKRSPVGQYIMGVTELHRYTPRSSESQN